MEIKIYFHEHEDYNQHRYYEKQDAYGQHSGEVTDGYFRAEDLRKEGKDEWAGFTPVFKNRDDAQDYASMAIWD